jgi:hypothetical protein
MKGTGIAMPESFWEPGVVKNRMRLSGLREAGGRRVGIVAPPSGVGLPDSPEVVGESSGPRRDFTQLSGSRRELSSGFVEGEAEGTGHR